MYHQFPCIQINAYFRRRQMCQQFKISETDFDVENILAYG